MLCDNCNKNEATIYYTQTVNGNHSKQHLCNECASTMGIPSFSSGSPLGNYESSLDGLLSTILGFPSSYKETKPYGQSNLVCDNCGMTYQEFLQKGKFGCNNCITSFSPTIDESLNRIHGSHTHTGKQPINYRGNSANTANTNTDTKVDSNDLGDLSLNESNESLDKEINDIDKLQSKLNKAVEKEEYEEAAKLRDKIRDLEKENKKSSNNIDNGKENKIDKEEGEGKG